MITKCVSITKPEERAINEDAVIANDSVIAVADGAGGGGVFAEAWSHYLLEHLPTKPFDSHEELDSWIDGIWEPYYNQQETVARHMDNSMLLRKFYEEGSFSTLAAIWHYGSNIKWVTYGDSMVFCYNTRTDTLESSCSHLADFANAPYLISCKDPLLSDGFRSGVFSNDKENIYIVTSDAIAHYIIMMYMVAHKDKYDDELSKAMGGHNKNANYIRTAMSQPSVQFKQVLSKLINCVGHKTNFSRHLKKLRDSHLLAVDDYSMAIMRI